MKGKLLSADDDAWRHVRETIKTIELSAEQSLLQLLESSMQQESIPLDIEMKNGYLNEGGNHDAALWIDRLLCDIYQCFPHVGQLSGTTKGTADTAIAQIVLTVIHAAHPQIQYDALLIHVNSYSL
jgi:hypothetical protein